MDRRTGPERVVILRDSNSEYGCWAILPFSQFSAEIPDDLIIVVTNVPMVDHIEDEIISHIVLDVTPSFAQILN
jgi:hypothetical protein